MSPLAHITDDNSNDKRRKIISTWYATSLQTVQEETFLQSRKADKDEAKRRHALYEGDQA